MRIGIGNFDVTPSPKSFTDAKGNLYLSFRIPRIPGGSYTIEVHAGGDMFRAGFQVIAAPTPTPTPTSTPTPTRIPLSQVDFGYLDATYYIKLPVTWRSSASPYSYENPSGTIKIELVAQPFSGTPAQWAERQTIPHAYFLHRGSSKDIGIPLAGSHFIQRFSSDHLCQDKDGLVIRESALVLDHRSAQPAGIAVHVDICQADLSDGNKEISREIIQSLRMR